MNRLIDKRIIVAITGASGAIYSRRLVQCLCEANADVHLVISPNGRRLINDELGISEIDATTFIGRESGQITLHPYRDVGSVLGSGSFFTDGMIVCPCSGNTLGAIAAGLGGNLIDRAAAVTLKEGRKLILVTREMPLNRIELQNLLRVNEAGGIICPACPGFYMLPTSINDLVDFVVGKLLDLVGVSHHLNNRWADRAADSPSARYPS